jgi:hypothetical protein
VRGELRRIFRHAAAGEVVRAGRHHPAHDAHAPRDERAVRQIPEAHPDVEVLALQVKDAVVQLHVDDDVGKAPRNSVAMGVT